jgi:uncharacterized protein (DUF697 family)
MIALIGGMKMTEALGPAEPGVRQTDERDAAAVAQRVDDANEIVSKYMYWGGAAGLLPIPIIDLALITTAQVKMLAELTELYGVPWREKVARNAVLSLASGLTSYGVSRYVSSALKAIPGAGLLASVAAQTFVGAALTYAVGKVFVMHYESGGSLMSFDAKKMRHHFSELYAEAINKETPEHRVSYAGVKP